MPSYLTYLRAESLPYSTSRLLSHFIWRMLDFPHDCLPTSHPQLYVQYKKNNICTKYCRFEDRLIFLTRRPRIRPPDFGLSVGLVRRTVQRTSPDLDSCDTGVSKTTVLQRPHGRSWQTPNIRFCHTFNLIRIVEMPLRIIRRIWNVFYSIW